MDIETFWFCLIAVLWAGYFLLEGFDFGVGMLLPFVPRDDRERGAALSTIGPVWDGNEVWLVVAGGATFAAFPAWYATMFSGFYVALLLVLVFLIVRVVSFEWRSKSESPRWRSAWTWANTVGSFGAALVWGIGLANLVHGVPIDGDGNYAGTFADLFDPYTVAAGVSSDARPNATYVVNTGVPACARVSVFCSRLMAIAGPSPSWSGLAATAGSATRAMVDPCTTPPA